MLFIYKLFPILYHHTLVGFAYALSCHIVEGGVLVSFFRYFRCAYSGHDRAVDAV